MAETGAQAYAGPSARLPEPASAALDGLSGAFRRLVTWRVALTRPVRSLFEGS